MNETMNTQTSYPGRLSTPFVNLSPTFPGPAEWAFRCKVAQEREMAYRKTLRGRVENFLYHLRGIISDLIAPEGWNAE
jgi:hypothetical protein